ncbi:hypothetical protein BKA70DRAFT_1220463 [Coprinopsis sp. MPI-PUGE-AT-0042]|nr:hypothetical protein BKA70DRAFT_1220463 [Coprinopsis sp. MPI-PUGE-AT-0042]
MSNRKKSPDLCHPHNVSRSDAQDFVSPTQIGFSGGSWVQQAARGQSQSHRDNEGSPSGGQQSLPSTFELFSTAANPSFGRFLHPDTNDLPLWISDIPLVANQNDRLPSPRPEPSYGSTQGIEGLATLQWDIFSNTSTRDNRPCEISIDTRSTSRGKSPRPPAFRGRSPGHSADASGSSQNNSQSRHNSPQVPSMCADGPSASTSSGRRINPLIGGLLGHSGCGSDQSANTSHSPSASNIVSYPLFYSHQIENYQVLTYTSSPPSMNFTLHVGMNHNPETCWVSFRGSCISSHCCNRKFHLWCHLLTGSPAFELQGGTKDQETLRNLRVGVAMLLPNASFTADNGEPGAITLQAFHPGNDPISEWVNYSMIGPHNPHTCTVLMNGMCCFSNCPSLQWYTIGAHVPSDAALHSDPDPFTRRYDVHDILPLKPPGFSD